MNKIIDASHPRAWGVGKYPTLEPMESLWFDKPRYERVLEEFKLLAGAKLNQRDVPTDINELGLFINRSAHCYNEVRPVNLASDTVESLFHPVLLAGLSLYEFHLGEQSDEALIRLLSGNILERSVDHMTERTCSYKVWGSSAYRLNECDDKLFSTYHYFGLHPRDADFRMLSGDQIKNIVIINTHLNRILENIQISFSLLLLNT